MDQNTKSPEGGVKTPPTKEQMIEWYTEQLPILRLRCEFAELDSRIAVASVQKMHALIQLNEIHSAGPDGANKEDNNTGKEDIK